MRLDSLLRPITRFIGSPSVLRRFALANLVANIVIVITGGAVRLSSSGLGCPTWPKCTDTQWTTTEEMGVHGLIEFGNRTLTGILGIIALIALLAAWYQRRTRPGLVQPAVLVLVGVGVQGVIGGITVRTGLNPYIVGLHFLVSMLLIAGAHLLWRRTRPDGQAGEPRLRPLAWAVTAASTAVLVIGVVVTGSGPHSGDPKARRIGLDPETISQLHVDAVFLVLGVTVAGLLAARAMRAKAPTRALVVLLGVLLGQGLIGFVQYFTALPAILVGFHLLGACLVWVATLDVLWSTRAAAPETGGSVPGQADDKQALDLVTAR